MYLARIDGPICQVKALLPYLVRRGPAPGPLFLSKDGSTLSRAKLVSAVHSALEAQRWDVRRFNGHSFRIGAATAAAACGMEDSFIQALGRRKSQAFTSYIRVSRSTLLSVSEATLWFCYLSTALFGGVRFSAPLGLGVFDTQSPIVISVYVTLWD